MAKLINITDPSGVLHVVNADFIEQIYRVENNNTDVTRIVFNNGTNMPRNVETELTVEEVAALLSAANYEVLVSQVTLSNAQVLALGTTAQTLVSAPGSGLRVKVIGVSLDPSGASAALSGGAVTVAQGGTALFSQAANTIQTTTIEMVQNTSGVSAANTATTLQAASAVSVFTDGTLKVTVIYVIVSE